MSTSRVLQKPPPAWRSGLLLLGCCELLPFTREGFGRGYFHLLWITFVLRSLILLPFPTAFGYANFQLVVSFALFVHIVLRFRPEWRAVLTQIDRFDPGKPARLWLLLRTRSVFFLFLLEPALAGVAFWALVTGLGGMNAWTPPFFLMVYSLDEGGFAMTDLPDALLSYTLWGMELLSHTDRRALAFFLLLLFPVSVLLNNVAEVRAERERPPAPSVPKSNEPELTFPTVGATRTNGGSGLPSFRAMGEQLQRKK